MSRDINDKILSELPPKLDTRIKELFESKAVVVRIATEWDQVKAAFCSPETEEVWKKLCKSQKREDLQDFVQSLCNLRSYIDTAWGWKETEKRAERLRSSLETLQKIRANAKNDLQLFASHDLYEYENSWEVVLKTIDENQKNFSARRDPSYQQYDILSVFFPISRRDGTEDSEAIFSIKLLSTFTRLILGKPYQNQVATLVNVLFGTSYTYSDVANNTKKLGKRLKVLEEGSSRPFYVPSSEENL